MFKIVRRNSDPEARDFDWHTHHEDVEMFSKFEKDCLIWAVIASPWMQFEV